MYKRQPQPFGGARGHPNPNPLGGWRSPLPQPFGGLEVTLTPTLSGARGHPNPHSLRGSRPSLPQPFGGLEASLTPTLSRARGRQRQGQPRGSAACFGGVFPKKTRVAEKPGSTNKSLILHKVLCRPDLHIQGEPARLGFGAETGKRCYYRRLEYDFLAFCLGSSLVFLFFSALVSVCLSSVSVASSVQQSSAPLEQVRVLLVSFVFCLISGFLLVFILVWCIFRTNCSFLESINSCAL